MAQIDKSSQRGSSLPPLELRVYRSRKDGKTILAHATYPAVIHGNRAIWASIPFGSPVQEAYRQAIAFAELHGIAIKVNDPNRYLAPED
jgi:hypothetical protein